mgnify:CR=1 FL=1
MSKKHGVAGQRGAWSEETLNMKENPEGKDNLEKIEIKQLWMAKSLLSPLQVLLIIKRKKEED